MPVLQRVLASGLILALLSACIRKPASPLAVPNSPQDGHENMVLSYDDSGTRPLKLQHFDFSSGAYTLELVSHDGSIPGTQPLEFRNRGAITAGSTAWKVTLRGEADSWNEVFKYDFFADPDLSYDPSKPSCLPAGTAKGQDWSAYTNLLCDIWVDPDKPIWAAGGWWLQQEAFFNQGPGNGFWANEKKLDASTGAWVPCGCAQDTYYEPLQKVSGTTFVPGLNQAAWSFNPVLDRSAAMDGSLSSHRWTRLAAVGSFWFILGGSVTGMIPGSCFYVDNPRLLRAFQPPWEGNPDASAFAALDPLNPSAGATYCYHPTSPNYSFWPAWRK